MQCIKTGFYGFLASHECFVYGDAFALPLPTHCLSPKAIERQLSSAGNFGNEPHSTVLSSNGHLLLRVCQIDADTPRISRINLLVHRVDHWFDERQTSAALNSTLLVEPGSWQWLGYEGTRLQDVPALASYATEPRT